MAETLNDSLLLPVMGMVELCFVTASKGLEL